MHIGGTVVVIVAGGIVVIVVKSAYWWNSCSYCRRWHICNCCQKCILVEQSYLVVVVGAFGVVGSVGCWSSRGSVYFVGASVVVDGHAVICVHCPLMQIWFKQ